MKFGKPTNSKAWLRDLRDTRAQAGISARIDRLALGNAGDHRSVGEGVMEMRIAYGPGYRIVIAGMSLSSCCAAVTGAHGALTSSRRTNWPKEKDEMATTRFDSAEFLESPEAKAEYLSEFLEDGSADEIRHAISTIARARGMTELARATGIRRENLYRVLGEDGNPEFATVLTVIRALGVNLIATCHPKKPRAATRSAATTRPGTSAIVGRRAAKAKATRR